MVDKTNAFIWRANLATYLAVDFNTGKPWGSHVEQRCINKRPTVVQTVKWEVVCTVEDAHHEGQRINSEAMKRIDVFVASTEGKPSVKQETHDFLHVLEQSAEKFHGKVRTSGPFVFTPDPRRLNPTEPLVILEAPTGTSLMSQLSGLYDTWRNLHIWQFAARKTQRSLTIHQ